MSRKNRIAHKMRHIVRRVPKPTESDIAKRNVPLQYLLSVSDESLESYELARLAHASNLDREIAMMQRERDAAKLAADAACWLRQYRGEIVDSIVAGFKRVGMDAEGPMVRPRLTAAKSGELTNEELAAQLAELNQQMKRIMDAEAEVTMGGVA